MISSRILDRIKESVERIEMELMNEGDICVRKLFGLCSCEGYRECFVPATTLDELVLSKLLELKDEVDWEVIDRAKRIWVERERFGPTEIALELISIAGKELEGKSPTEWRVYI